MRGAAPRTGVQALATNRTKPHTRTRAPQRPLARGAYMDRVERPEWPACTTGRGDRRAATALRRTTNEAFSARYLRACAVPHDGDKRRRFLRALPARVRRLAAGVY